MEVADFMRHGEASGQYTDATRSGQYTDDLTLGSRMLVTNSNWDWGVYEVDSEGGHQFTNSSVEPDVMDNAFMEELDESDSVELEEMRCCDGHMTEYLDHVDDQAKSLP